MDHEHRNFTSQTRMERMLSDATRTRLTRDMLAEAEARLSAGPVQLTPGERGEFSVARVLGKLAAGNFGSMSCFEAEVLEEVATRTGRQWDATKPEIPFELLARDLTSAGTSGSNYLVDAPVAAAVDALFPWSVTAQAGITVLPNLTGNTSVPRTTTAQTGYWLSTEATTVTEGQPTLGSLVLTPKHCGAYVELSRLLSLQSDAEPFLTGHLMNVVGKLIDTAVFAGSGSSGQPLGLTGTTGILTESGTSLGAAGLAEMELDVAANDAQNLAVIATPTIRKLLRGREVATGSGPVWSGASVLGYPAYATTTMPAGTLVVGAWDRCALGLWGGLTVEVNPYAGFQSGVRALRLMVSLDVGFTTPGAFSVASSVT